MHFLLFPVQPPANLPPSRPPNAVVYHPGADLSGGRGVRNRAGRVLAQLGAGPPHQASAANRLAYRNRYDGASAELHVVGLPPGME